MAKEEMNFNLSNNGANLSVAAVNFSGVGDSSYIKTDTQQIFNELGKFLPKGTYFLYVRDLKEYSIDGKYPGGHTYNQHESMIALPSWRVDRKLVLATIAHELHHLARWQHAGYGATLGEAILSEGIATLYESQVANWSPPWSQAALDSAIIKKALEDWDNDQYDHIDWFFDGKYGRWVGYTIGFQVARLLLGDGIDIKKSLELTVADFDNKAMLDRLK